MNILFWDINHLGLDLIRMKILHLDECVEKAEGQWFGRWTNNEKAI